MKQCPRCRRTYSDEMLNFCLEDGELLEQFAGASQPTQYADDTPPTVILDRPRVTNPASWSPPASPPQRWEPQIPVAQPFWSGPSAVGQDKMLPVIGMILGIASLALVCCYGGIWLGLPAAVIGFLGMRNADSDPARYGGRGMAIAGLVIGIVSFLATIIFAIFAIIGSAR